MVLDFHMPGLDGIEACARIRELRPGVPVVLCSGNPETKVWDRLGEGGPDVFLQKPFTLRELRAGLRRALGESPGG